jgi:MFS family permease
MNLVNFLSLPIPQPVWIQAIARGLYQFGSAVLLFYMPIVFVNYNTFSAIEVGLAIGGGSIAGFIGNLIGGGMADSQRFGRKGTLLISAVLAIAAATVMIVTQSFALLLLSNILLGLSTGLYWTAADASVMDATAATERQQAFSVLGVLDNVGFGVGTLLGGVLLQWLQPASLVFAASLLIFMGFLLTVGVGMTETRQDAADANDLSSGWGVALRDKQLMTYLLVNTLFITFFALVNSTLPLYFVNFAATSDQLVSHLFTWGYVGLGALVQVPIVRAIAALSYLRSLMLSMAIWGVGFLLTWQLGGLASGQVTAELMVFAVFAIATSLYKPTSSAWIAELAPASLRGVYTAIAYQCWSLGYVIGPIVGRWAIDQPRAMAQNFWLGVAASTLVGLLVLQLLDQRHRAVAIENQGLAE